SSKYGISRTIRVVLDLLTVKFLLSYLGRPMQLFGLIGLATLGLGSLILAVLVGERLFLGTGLGDRPSLILAVLLTVLGAQFLSVGLLGELTTRVYHETGGRPPYFVRRVYGSAGACWEAEGGR